MRSSKRGARVIYGNWPISVRWACVMCSELHPIYSSMVNAQPSRCHFFSSNSSDDTSTFFLIRLPILYQPMGECRLDPKRTVDLQCSSACVQSACHLLLVVNATTSDERNR